MMRTLLQTREIRFSQATIYEFDENEHEGRRDAHVGTSEHSDDGGDEPRAPATRYYRGCKEWKLIANVRARTRVCFVQATGVIFVKLYR